VYHGPLEPHLLRQTRQISTRRRHVLRCGADFRLVSSRLVWAWDLQRSIDDGDCRGRVSTG
jgi:hypothetical protein